MLESKTNIRGFSLLTTEGISHLKYTQAVKLRGLTTAISPSTVTTPTSMAACIQ